MDKLRKEFESILMRYGSRPPLTKRVSYAQILIENPPELIDALVQATLLCPECGSRMVCEDEFCGWNT